MKDAQGYVKDNIALLDEYKERALRLTTGNKDWERLADAITGHTIVSTLGVFNSEKMYASLRCLTAVAYAMGYERGRGVKNMPDFVVAPGMKGEDND